MRIYQKLSLKYCKQNDIFNNKNKKINNENNLFTLSVVLNCYFNSYVFQQQQYALQVALKFEKFIKQTIMITRKVWINT
ncbi:unnamed protein product [Paramecium sonneborni]|uniref:Uncharacterized protein n=1 Tax=Paramecium sonneborni TaxID=65129 RepID=A0A8S1P1X6_9CILI|nr:unnamed protein product [Paramecium sonneborni]